MVVLAIVLLAVVVAVPLGLVLFNAMLAWRVERLVPPRGRFVTIDGVRLHYMDQGSGPPLLLLHGLAAQLQTYTYALGDRLESRYRLIMPDRPGSGYSRPASDATLATQAKLMSGLLRHLGVERALVVGHSLGGTLALAFAIYHPDQVAGLVLISPATQPMSEAPKALEGLAVRSDPVRWIFGWTIASLLAIRHRTEVMSMLFGPETAPPDFATRGGGVLTLRPWIYRNACRDLAGVAVDLPLLARRYGEIATPVGVLYGTGDNILDPTLHGGKLRQQIAGLELDLIEDGGHMAPISSPARCIAAIEAVAARARLDPGGTGAAAPSADVQGSRG